MTNINKIKLIVAYALTANISFSTMLGKKLNEGNILSGGSMIGFETSNISNDNNIIVSPFISIRALNLVDTEITIEEFRGVNLAASIRAINILALSNIHLLLGWGSIDGVWCGGLLDIPLPMSKIYGKFDLCVGEGTAKNRGIESSNQHPHLMKARYSFGSTFEYMDFGANLDFSFFYLFVMTTIKEVPQAFISDKIMTWSTSLYYNIAKF